LQAAVQIENLYAVAASREYSAQQIVIADKSLSRTGEFCMQAVDKSITGHNQAPGRIEWERKKSAGVFRKTLNRLCS
jgi:hypothetical protein